MTFQVGKRASSTVDWVADSTSSLRMRHTRWTRALPSHPVCPHNVAGSNSSSPRRCSPDSMPPGVDVKSTEVLPIARPRSHATFPRVRRRDPLSNPRRRPVLTRHRGKAVARAIPIPGSANPPRGFPAATPAARTRRNVRPIVPGEPPKQQPTEQREREEQSGDDSTAIMRAAAVTGGAASCLDQCELVQRVGDYFVLEVVAGRSTARAWRRMRGTRRTCSSTPSGHRLQCVL